MPELIDECPICKSSSFESFLICKDYTQSHENFKIVTCTNCGFKLTNPRPDIIEVEKYYQSESYISHSNTNKGLINKLYQLVRNLTLKKKLKLITFLNKNSSGKVLDIGCGTGMFLKICKENNWETFGTEPDEKTRIFAIENSKTEIKQNIFTDYESQKFDIITMWHVFEHIHDLNKNIERIKELMNTNSFLIIAVPNCDSYDAKIYKQYWAAYDVPRHLSHFNLKSLNNLIKAHGMSLVKTKGMLFDTFYISLLSTKYKNNFTNYIKAIIIGLLSNIKGLFTKNYSSNIYIVKKNN